MPPLFLVGGTTRPEIVRLLLDAGGDVTFKSEFGKHPGWLVIEGYKRSPDYRPFGDEVIEMFRDAYEAAGLDADALIG